MSRDITQCGLGWPTKASSKLAAMGNHTGSDDYRLYARPQDGQAQDSVHIIDDGGPAPFEGPAGGAGGAGDRGNRADGSGGDRGDRTGADGVQGPEAPRGFAASDGSRRRFNPYLCAAWALVAIMLATGLSWLTGALEPPTYVSVDPSTGQGMEGRPGVIVSNLYSMGPFVLLFGLLGALTLLTVQAAAFRRRYGR